MIGQMVCMCECAEIALGKHRLAWELDHISTVPASESAVTSACLLLFSLLSISHSALT